MLPSSCSTAMLWRSPSAIKPAIVEDSHRKERITQSLPSFSHDLVDLVDEYLSYLTLAALPLQVDERRVLIKSEKNQDIRTAIKEVLTSAQTDPKIKRQIIVNVMQYKYQQEFRILIEELHTMDMHVNLDNTDLSNLRLTGIYLVHASAVNLNLSESTLIFVNFSDGVLTNANLKGTTFIDSVLENTDLRGAQIDETDFSWCSAQDLVTNDHELSSVSVMSDSDLFLKGVHTTQTAHFQLRSITLNSVPLRCLDFCVIG